MNRESLRRLVVDFADQRPIFTLPAWVADRLRAALPPDWTLHIVSTPADGTGDGAAAASAEVIEAVRSAEAYFGYGVPAEILRQGAGLRWVHSGTAGVRSSLTPEMLERDVVFTNSAGVHAPAMAETVLAMILHFARGLDHAVRAQAAGRWDKRGFDAVDAPVREVAGSTVGIVGYGGIGREVAKRARAFGARVIALKRRPARPERDVEIVYGRDGLERILEESDYIVLSAPETPETQGLIDAAALARLRPHAVLVNVARGGLVDEDALVDALRGGRLRGAALDVFATEPLPETSPLWRLPNVLITPHVSAYTHRFWERECALLEANLARYLAGQPLLNVVDKRAGY
ncbi:MAG TPA: D-2-hydroxyacid dehydrogenase [Longimicrobiales bacterium]